MRATGLAGVAVMGIFLGGCMMMRHGGAERPAASEFGLGPRASGGGAYLVTVEPAAPLRVRRMQSVKLVVRTADRAPVEGARITIDGGMPEHGHGLPTEPRVTRTLGAGVYQVEGLKFNMGGWWELRFRIASAAGTDSVTFNLDL
jgi:hypothetical protein